MIRAGKTVLGSFEMTARQTIVIPLPVELTTGTDRAELAFIHPDAPRPRDHLAADDSRRLALCFHSANLTRTKSDGANPSLAAGAASLEPVHGIIAGGATAMAICQVISKLPSLKGRFGVRYADTSNPSEQAAETLPAETLDTMRFCWLRLNAGLPESRDPLHDRSGSGVALRTFYSPIVRSLWPFQAQDPRAVGEAGYRPARYPYGDRLAQVLVGMNMPDDVLYLMYNMSAGQEHLDLDEAFANDLRRWRSESKKSDMQLAGFIERHFKTSRVFFAPNRSGSILLREMVDRVLDDPLVSEIASPEVLVSELDVLLDKYIGLQEELPVHKRIAAHFELSWWSPDMKYRWMNNLHSYRDYILDYIKWTQWRP
jgi:hypothetical protein